MALVVGANIGTALNPLLEGARTGEAAGRRVAVGNVITRLVGTAVALPLLSWIGPQFVQIEPNLSHAVADFHTAFNIVLGLPLLGPFMRLLERMLPDRIESRRRCSASISMSQPLRRRQSRLAMPLGRSCGWSTCSIRFCAYGTERHCRGPAAWTTFSTRQSRDQAVRDPSRSRKYD